LRLSSFGGYGLALAALALVVFGAYDSSRKNQSPNLTRPNPLWRDLIQTKSTYRNLMALARKLITDACNTAEALGECRRSVEIWSWYCEVLR